MPEISPSRSHWHAADRRKTCIVCGGSKLLSEFYAYGYRTHGKRSVRYDSRCKPCARARRRAQHHADPIRSAETSRSWRERNPEMVKDGALAYRRSDHGRKTRALIQRMRAARKRASVDLDEDPEAIRAIYEEAARVEKIIACCPVFDDPILTKRMDVDHIIPLSKGGRHISSNLQILPHGLNIRKAAKCPK